MYIHAIYVVSFLLVLSVDNLLACGLFTEEQAQALAKKEPPKPPSPLMNAARRGNVNQLQEMLLDSETDVHAAAHRDEGGRPLCVQVATNAQIPRQVSVLSLLIQCGDHAFCCSRGRSVSDCQSTQAARDKIQQAVVQALNAAKTEMAAGLIVIITDYMANVKPPKKMICQHDSADDGA